jgi:triosephosphate isomerase (TIM)
MTSSLKSTKSRPIFVANWSPYSSNESSELIISKLLTFEKPLPEQYYLALPYRLLTEFNKNHADSGFIFGLETFLSMEDGGFTEPIAGKFPKDVNASFVLVGSYDQKKVFTEAGQNLAKKIKALLQESVTPFVCVGETLQDYESGNSEHILTEQLNSALAELTPHQLLGVVVVYEAPWIHQFPMRPSLDQLLEAYQRCREILRKIWDVQLGNGIRLVGGIPHDFEDLSSIIKSLDINGLYLSHATLHIDQLQRLFSSDLQLHERIEPEARAEEHRIAAEKTLEAVEVAPAPVVEVSEKGPKKMEERESEPEVLPTTDYTEEYFQIVPKENPEEKELE